MIWNRDLLSPDQDLPCFCKEMQGIFYWFTTVISPPEDRDGPVVPYSQGEQAVCLWCYTGWSPCDPGLSECRSHKAEVWCITYLPRLRHRGERFGSLYREYAHDFPWPDSILLSNSGLPEHNSPTLWHSMLIILILLIHATTRQQWNASW